MVLDKAFRKLKDCLLLISSLSGVIISGRVVLAGVLFPKVRYWPTLLARLQLFRKVLSVFKIFRMKLIPKLQTVNSKVNRPDNVSAYRPVTFSFCV